MTTVLSVDTSALSAAANTLKRMAFPVAPEPAAVTGTHPAAAAIDSVLPSIESPVTDGLAAARKAFEEAGSNISSAAAIYAGIDQKLGHALSQLNAASPQPGKMTAECSQMASQLGSSSALPATAVAAVVPLAQSLPQFMQAATSSLSGSGHLPTQLGIDSSTGPPPAPETSVNDMNAGDRDLQSQSQARTPDERTSLGSRLGLGAPNAIPFS